MPTQLKKLVADSGMIYIMADSISALDCMKESKDTTEEGKQSNDEDLLFLCASHSKHGRTYAKLSLND